MKFCLPTKLLTKFAYPQNFWQILKWQRRKNSRHFCRQIQSDNGRLHQQTNLLTVFGPRGFNWQLVLFTSAVRRNIFQSKLSHEKEKLNFFLHFVPNYSLGKLTSKTFNKTKMDARRQRTFKVSVSFYVARISAGHARPTSYQKKETVSLFLLTFIFNMPSKMNQLSFVRKAFLL